MQTWIQEKTHDLETIAESYGLTINDTGFRGKYLNRGIYLEDNDMVKLAQLALFIEDGILVGALPNSLRYQPMLFELSETNRLTAHAIFKRVAKVGRVKLARQYERRIKRSYT